MTNKVEAVLAIIIGFLALWPNLIAATSWIILISAILLLFDSFRARGAVRAVSVRPIKRAAKKKRR